MVWARVQTRFRQVLVKGLEKYLGEVLTGFGQRLGEGFWIGFGEGLCRV